MGHDTGIIHMVAPTSKCGIALAAVTSTEFAAKLGINLRTLKRWLSEGRIAEPSKEMIAIGGFRSRDWTDGDLKRVLEFKEANYRKGRGRNPAASPRPKGSKPRKRRDR
jgi:hypothetical protein